MKRKLYLLKKFGIFKKLSHSCEVCRRLAKVDRNGETCCDVHPETVGEQLSQGALSLFIDGLVFSALDFNRLACQFVASVGRLFGSATGEPSAEERHALFRL